MRPVTFISSRSIKGSAACGLSALAAVSLWLCSGGAAVAQLTSPIAPSTGFPVSVVAPEGAIATAVNPSAIGNFDRWSFAYSHVDAADGTLYADRSDSGWLTRRLGGVLALGTGLEFIRSRTEGLASSNGFVLGGALNLGPNWSLGSTWHVRSPRAGKDAHTADVALTFRPAKSLAVSLIGRDLAANPAVLGDVGLRRSGVLAVSSRPLGDERLVLELAGLVDRAEQMGARVTAQAFVPYVGRLAAAGELRESSGRDVWTFTAGVDLRWGSLSVAPALHGSKDGDLGWSILADIHGQPRPGLPGAGYIAKIPLGDLSARPLLNVIRSMELALHDPRVRGVLLEPSDTGVGIATAQEVRLMIKTLQDAGKPVYCHLEAATGSEYYLCAGAQRVSIDPAGLVRLMGVSSDALYFGDLLRSAGIRADFVRIGRYKSAPEQHTNSGSSEGAREERSQLLNDAFARLVHDIAQDTALSETEVKALFDRGPFLPREAISAHLLDAEVDVHDMERDTQELYGSRMMTMDQSKRAAHGTFGPTGQIGVVVIDGAIVDGDNVDVPFFDVHLTGGRTVAKTIDGMADNPRIRAIVLRIDSPGGAVMASDQIWRAVTRARAKKPVIASMGDVAASGGYYVAAAANEIWASPSTITGSIGIFYGKVDLAPLAARFGVGIESDKRGQHAGAESLFRPLSDEERASIVEKLRLWYRQFLERVSVGRNMPIDRVDSLARGRVYSGDSAQTVGLVDKLGGFGSALARARELTGLPVEAELVVQPQRPSSLLDYVLGPSGSKGQLASEANSQQSPVPAALRPMLGQLYLMGHLSGGEPVALYEGPLQLN